MHRSFADALCPVLTDLEAPLYHSPLDAMIGSWEIEHREFGADGELFGYTGEAHFTWIFGGRAIQDIWIVPGPDHWTRTIPAEGCRGTTIRFYNSGIDRWQSFWIDPMTNRLRALIGTPTDDGIELLSDDRTPHLRWQFRKHGI